MAWHPRSVMCAALLLLLAALAGSCRREPPPREDGRVVIEYWEKWVDFEKDAMQEIVDLYNASQDKVWVNYLSTGQIDQKLLLATAGGNPPDVAGLWAWRLYTYADMGALEPLDGLMKRDGIAREQYLPSIIDQCEYNGFTWALPTTPATLALHYNKRMFAEAGLDPAVPPRTLAELDEFARRLTKRDDDGRITQLGFSPTEPGWWNDRWGYWFGADLLDDAGRRLTINSPENLAAFEWIQGYPRTHGFRDLQSFQASGGQFNSGQNLFLAGRVAMVLQGVWMSNYVAKFNPDLEWAAAPFPAVSAEMDPVTICEADVLVIPKGCRHKQEAWDFIKFVQRPENMERLCLGQRKFSPLARVREGFYDGHPNPEIRVFRQLAESPNAKGVPKTLVYSEYRNEITNAFDLVWRLEAEPKEALAEVERRIQPKLDRAVLRWERIAEERREEWARQ